MSSGGDIQTGPDVTGFTRQQNAKLNLTVHACNPSPQETEREAQPVRAIADPVSIKENTMVDATTSEMACSMKFHPGNGCEDMAE